MSSTPDSRPLEPPPRMSVGGVLGSAWAMYVKNFGRLVAIALPVFLVLDLGFALISRGVGDLHFNDGGILPTSNVPVGLGFGGLAWVLVSVIGWLWVQGALVFAVKDARDGAAVTSVRGLLERTWPYVWRLLGAGILAVLGIVLGFAALLLPGIYLAVRWSLIVPAILLEGASIGESFGRSHALVKGHFWAVLGTLFVALVISGVATELISLPFFALPDFLEVWLGGAIPSAVTFPFVAAVFTYTYFALAAVEDARAPL